jgi:hypothetical protein
VIFYIDSSAYREGLNVVSPLNFRLSSSFVITPFASPFVGTPMFLDYPLIKINKNSPFHYHTVHIDSVSDYSANDFYTYDLVETNNLSVPAGFVINPISGEIIWDNPSIEGLYQFTVNVNRFRNGIYISSIKKNITIHVNDIETEPIFYHNQNWLTNTEGYYEYRIAPNDNLQLFFAYNDTLADSIGVSQVGDAFHYVNPAFFNTFAIQDQTYGFFEWTPDNSYVSEYPHRVNFVCHSKIDTIDLYHYLTVLIYVELENHLSIEENTIQTNIFPNPTTSILNVEVSEEILGGELKIYDILGNQVWIEKINSNKFTIDNFANLSEGVYTILFSKDAYLETQKVVKQ